MLTRFPWRGLSRIERRIVASLSFANPREERIGVELDSFPRNFCPAILRLVDEGIVEVKLGWRNTVWVRLREPGRRVEAS